MGKERKKICKAILVGSECQAEVCGLACWAMGVQEGPIPMRRARATWRGVNSVVWWNPES